jgi:hypothetical protein
MSVAGVFGRRVRGFRVVEVAGLGLLLSMVLGVYLAKTFAGRERADIAAAEVQILDEKARVRLLKAEVAHLEQPRRVELLAGSFMALKPIAADHEITEDALIDVARRDEPQVAPTAASAPTTDVLAADAPEAVGDEPGVAEPRP